VTAKPSLSREKARREEVWVVLENNPIPSKNVSPALSSVASKVASPSISAARLRSCPVRRWISAPCAMYRPADGHTATVHDPENGPCTRQHCCLTPCRSGGKPRRGTFGIDGPTRKKVQIVTGVVKNITDYGAFIDLGGVDGLLHVTDISWKRVNHPSEVLSVGQSIEGSDYSLQRRKPAYRLA
jgi:small subunit ribosomal protein S1